MRQNLSMLTRKPQTELARASVQRGKYMFWSPHFALYALYISQFSRHFLTY